MVTTQFAGPFAGSPITTQDQWRLFLTFLGEGVIRGASGELACSVGDGTTVTVAGGAALVQSTTYQQSGDPLALPIPVNGSGAARADRCVLRYDPSAQTLAPAVLTGTSGTLPALTRNPVGVWEMPLAHWVKQSGGNVTGFVDDRVWLGPGMRSCTSGARPVLAGVGDIAYETDTARWIGYNGSAWQVIAQDSGWVSVSPFMPWYTPGSGQNAPAVRAVNGIGVLSGAVFRGNATLPEGDDRSDILQVPAQYMPSRDWTATCSFGNENPRLARLILDTSDRWLFLSQPTGTMPVGFALYLSQASGWPIG